MLQAEGTPRQFDVVLRTPVRVVVNGLGLAGSVLCLWMNWVWFVPLPFVVSLLLVEWFFYARADRPLRLQFSGEALAVKDGFLGTEKETSLQGLMAATAIRRQLEPGWEEVVVVLTGAEGHRAGLQFRLPEDSVNLGTRVVDADVCNAVLGSISGLIRALCPREQMIRQKIGDPAALAWLMDHIPEPLWSTTVVRYWEGKEPELDLFGYHASPPKGLLWLHNDRCRWDDGEWIEAGPGEVGVGHRTAVIFRMSGEEHSETEESLPLWLQPLAQRCLAIPAPLLSDPPNAQDPTPTVHVHAPEGAVVLWHLWHAISEDQWPIAWIEALKLAAPHVRRWPPSLPTVERLGTHPFNDGPSGVVGSGGSEGTQE